MVNTVVGGIIKLAAGLEGNSAKKGWRGLGGKRNGERAGTDSYLRLAPDRDSVKKPPDVAYINSQVDWQGFRLDNMRKIYSHLCQQIQNLRTQFYLPRGITGACSGRVLYIFVELQKLKVN